jgi:predicted nucleotidyltransferase
MKELIIKNIIHEIINELKSKYPDFKGIYFFGSRARGDNHQESDYDLALIFSRKINAAFEEELFKLLYRYDLKYNILIDSHIFSETEILKPATPFRSNIIKEGIYYGF